MRCPPTQDALQLDRMSDDLPDPPLRPNVCMLIHNRDGQIFLGQRLGELGVWQLPQGGVDRSYPLEENVIREVHEELGVERERIRVVRRLEATHEYQFIKTPEYYAGKWRGQSQTFWIVEYLGSDAEIDLDRFEPEFSAWRWASVEEVRQLAEPKRVPGYLAPLREFEAYWNSRSPSQ